VEWEEKMKEMFPSYGISLTENPSLFQDLHTSTGRTLGLNEKETVHN
ncbi:malate:quinone oxidoreductase, partial [Bacillus cereus]|nr:malate:quinone oxidoreductase [Bacillus cereus]